MMNWRFLLVAICLIGFSSVSVAKTQLKRNSFLGVVPENTQTGEVVVVQQLHPQGTAHILGLTIGDKINVINDQAIADFSALIRVLNGIDEGEPITLNITRDDKQLTLTAKAQGRPQEQGAGYSVKYSDFSWQQERIRTIGYFPDKPREDGAAVLFIQGYTCGSIDYGMIPNASLNKLLGHFAQAGFIVMKMEKPGVGDSEGELDCHQYDFDTENKAFIAGLTHFKQQQGVNTENVFVFGHSLGVLHAAVIAEQGLTKGVIGYGGVVKPWIDYMHDIYAKQSVKYWGVDAEQAKKNVSIISPFLEQWLNTNDSWTDINLSSATKRVVSEGLIAINNEQVIDRHYSFFRSINRIDFKSLWANSKSHALMLHGDYDVQAIDGDWAKQITTLVNQQAKVYGKSLFFKRTDHSLMKFNNTSELMRFTRRQTNDLGIFNQQIATSSIHWMENTLAHH